jgi:WD40 repeat protein
MSLMCPRLRITNSFLLLSSFLFFLSCTPKTPVPSLQTRLVAYRFQPSALLEFSQDWQVSREIPFSLPPNCGLLDLFAPPLGRSLAIELSCPNGQTVLFLNTDAGTVAQPVTGADSHFLAWTFDGRGAYLKVDSLGNAHIVRVEPGGRQEIIKISEFTYDLAASPGSNDFTFTYSGGLGQGSELWLAKQKERTVRQLYTDSFHYLSFARYSPDGKKIAFIKIPDTQTPFTVGELWVIDANGSSAHKLAEADAGHGYAASWSPDGKEIAFVVRENPGDPQADQSAQALISNLYLVEVDRGTRTKVTHLDHGRVETPLWSPDGNTLAFNTVINDRMEVRIADLRTGEIWPLTAESACCAVWMRK